MTPEPSDLDKRHTNSGNTVFIQNFSEWTKFIFGYLLEKEASNVSIANSKLLIGAPRPSIERPLVYLGFALRAMPGAGFPCGVISCVKG